MEQRSRLDPVFLLLLVFALTPAPTECLPALSPNLRPATALPAREPLFRRHAAGPAGADVTQPELRLGAPQRFALRGRAKSDPFAGYKITEEVQRPIQRPADVTPCAVTLLYNQNFSSFPGTVPVTYRPPKATSCGSTWQLVVLTVTSYVSGRQFDRRFSFELDSVLLLASTTAEPVRRPGVEFWVERDVTAYSSFLHKPHSGAVTLPNVVDDTYTGVFYVTVELVFFPGIAPAGLPDLVIGVPNSAFTVPPNTVQAKLDVYISQYQKDEFYYSNVPNSYFDALTPDQQGWQTNGSSFREVVAYLDGTPVGAVFPQPLIYSGGIDPLFWAPFMGIGSLFCPTYSVDITPFVGKLLDGVPHNISFGVTFEPTGAFWVAAGALFLWKDAKLQRTSGDLVLNNFGALDYLEQVNSKPGNPVDATITVTAGRVYEFTGRVTTSAGNVTTRVRNSLDFTNTITITRKGLTQGLEFLSTTNTTIQSSADGGALLGEVKGEFGYPLSMNFDVTILPEDSFTQYSRVSHGVLNDISSNEGAFERLVNVQEASSYRPSSNFSDARAATTQSYEFKGSDGCYTRQVASDFAPSTRFNVTYDSTNTTAC